MEQQNISSTINILKQIVSGECILYCLQLLLQFQSFKLSALITSIEKHWGWIEKWGGWTENKSSISKVITGAWELTSYCNIIPLLSSDVNYYTGVHFQLFN